MVKAWPIKDCRNCPRFMKSGAYGKILHIPICTKEDKVLPHNKVPTRSGRVRASAIGVIPDWCPLQTIEEE